MKSAAVSLAFMVFTASAWCIGSNSKPADITGVADAGTISKDQYRNGFFNLVVDAPDATLRLNPLVDKPGQRARLVQVLAKPAKWDNTYTFAVLADALGNYPQLQSPAQYVRSVRHQLEKEGMPTVRDEFAIVISGIEFSGAILQEHIESGRKYYRGLFAAFRNGYILPFDLEAASPDKVKEVATRLVRFKAAK